MTSEEFGWLSQIPAGIVHADGGSSVIFSTDKARRLLGLPEKEEEMEGLRLSEALPQLWGHLREAISRGSIKGEVAYSFFQEVLGGRTVRISAQMWKNEDLILTIDDVTEFEWAKSEERAMREEIDRAFSFSLLEPSVARKLRCTPEHLDEEAAPGLIRITGVIPDGGYRHAINILKLAADLDVLDLFEFPGLSRRYTAHVTIYHDLAKTQPILNVGEVVDPRETFSPGKLHAQEGAAMAQAYYGLDEDECQIIKYHHHEEKGLPKDFPSSLLPQLRLFKVLDGLSAGMTRRNASIHVGFEGGWLYISEKSSTPEYAGSYAINLYNGEERPVPADDVRLKYQTQRIRPLGL